MVSRMLPRLGGLPQWPPQPIRAVRGARAGHRSASPPAAGGMLAAMAAEEPEPTILPIEDSLDLHAFAPRDIPSVVGEYLEQAVARGFREVRLIHGKGTGTQRAIVRSVLARHPAVDEFFDGPPERGGWGATVVRLRA